MVTWLTDEEKAAVATAVGSAEARTTGEIYCVVAEESSDYRETPLAWGAGAALLGPALLLLLGVEVSAPAMVEGWTAAQVGAAAETAARGALIGAILLQGALFVAVALLVSWRPVRLFLTPPPLKQARARERAQELFLAKGIHETAGRTGVLIYVSLAEHRVELVADEAIDATVEPSVWTGAVDALVRGLKAGRLAEGLIAAVGVCADVLAQHFPPRPQNPNELPDEVVEITKP